MKRILVSLLALLLVASLTLARAAEPLPIERQVAEAIKAPGVTVVHFWATWCPNCRAELVSGGWRDLVNANENVNFIFITAWDAKPGAPLLRQFGLSAQKNFQSLQHPNASRIDGEKLESFLGLPMTWLPTTWIFRNGRLRYALNYGEVNFPILRQLVGDAGDKEKWNRPDLPPEPASAP